jgi:pyridoxal phosphate enzyme (YggS family)
MMIDVKTLEGNLLRVRERVSDALRRSGRPEGEVALMAVTKTHPAEIIDVALAAGLELFGENRVQEAQSKYQTIVQNREASPLTLQLIGHLQRNKAKIAASLFSCVQSIDKLETAEALERHCGAIGCKMDVLLEMNTSGEATKFGFDDEPDLVATLERIAVLENLRVRGLMTIGPFTDDRDRIRTAFARLREIYERLRRDYAELQIDTLSMGMSGDFEIAIEEGSTLIRLGTVLFGPRGLA